MLCSLLDALAGKFTLDGGRRHGELGMPATLDPRGNRSQLRERRRRHTAARVGERSARV